MRSVNIKTASVEERPAHGAYRSSGARVATTLGATEIGGSLYELAEGDSLFPYHFHHGVEEWLIVVVGAPMLRTPDGEQELRPGDCVVFPDGPEGAHAVRGPGRVLMLSHGSEVSVAVYPDSDKVGARPAAFDSPDRLNFKRGDAVDYWEGE